MAKEEYLKRFKEKFPDKKYEENEDELWKDAHEEYSALNEYKNKNTEVNKRLMEILQSHPEIMHFIKDVDKGAPINVALARNFDLENIDPVDGDEDMEAWKKAKEERASKLAAKDEYIKNFDANTAASGKTLKKFIEANNLSEEQAESFLSKVEAIFSDAMDGKLEESTLTALYTAENHDQIVSDEKKKATIQAKNEKIKAEIEKENAKKGDGLPAITGGGGALESPKEKQKPNDGFSNAIDNTKRIL